MRSGYRAGLLWLAAMALLLWYVLARLQVANDLTQFLPRESGEQERQVVTLLREGGAARLLLIGLAGGDEKTLAQSSAALAARLRTSPLFERVSNGSEEMDDAERERWFRYRYLLTPMHAGESLSVAGLRQALQARLAELGSPLGLLDKQRLPADPVAAFAALLRQWQPQTRLQYRHGVWFSADGQQALLLAVTRAGGFALDAQQQAIADVEREVAALAQGRPLQLTMSGPGYIGVMTRAAIRGESQWLSVLASVVVALLLWWAYRSLPLLLLSALPLLSALLVGVAVTLTLFGSVHGITLAFGITLLGVAIDYPLHLFSHLQGREPARHTLLRIWPTLRLGVLSTAVGYLAMVGSEFAGLQQLAVFAVGGLLTAAAVVRWVLPPLLGARAVPVGRLGALPPVPHWGGKRAQRLMLAAALLALAYLVLSPLPLWQSDLAALSPIPAQVRAQDAQLRRQLGAADLTHLLLVGGDSEQQVLQRCEALRPALARLREEGVIGPFLLPSDLLPSAQWQRRQQQALPTAAELERRLQRAGNGLPFRPGLFRPFVAAVGASAALAPLTPDDLAGSTLGLRLQSLLRRDGQRWLGVVQLGEVYAPARLAQWAQQPPAAVDYVDVKATTARMVTRFRDEALGYFLLGLLLITLLLRFGLHGWRPLVPVLLPVVSALALVLALLHALGMMLSLFNLVALLLVVGIGIDYGLFFARGGPQEERRRTGHAVALCAISTVSVFGILALSHIPVLRAIGLTVALGVSLSYLLARWGRAPARSG